MNPFINERYLFRTLNHNNSSGNRYLNSNNLVLESEQENNYSSLDNAFQENLLDSSSRNMITSNNQSNNMELSFHQLLEDRFDEIHPNFEEQDDNFNEKNNLNNNENSIMNKDIHINAQTWESSNKNINMITYLDQIEEINYNSESIDHPDDLTIILKKHQLQIIKKCIHIEEENLCHYGILCDKPGAGKTFAILGLIYASQKKNNLIVIPQNLLNQWIHSIHQFSDGLLTYKKIVSYEDILNFYDDKKQDDLNNYDILITTSLFYHSLATTLNSRFLKISRIIFDEVDSISSIINCKINHDFIWFISASFELDLTGTFDINKNYFKNIAVKCNDDYVDKLFEMDKYNSYSMICRNIYLDNIFTNIIDQEEFSLLNALDYTKLKNKYQYKIASNEVEAIKYLICDKKDIIEYEKMRIQDLEKTLTHCTVEDQIKMNTYLLKKAQNSLQENTEKLDLIINRLKENNCCLICYTELENKKKLLSPCCKNIICYECTHNWCNKNYKTNCIYCNTPNIDFPSYVLIKNNDDNQCNICDNYYEIKNDKKDIDYGEKIEQGEEKIDQDEEKIEQENVFEEIKVYKNKLYSQCCEKSACHKCVNDWFLKLYKKECLFCHDRSILYEDFKNEQQHQDMLTNIKNGLKYTKKSKQEFLKYFIIAKINSMSKVIFCSEHPKIFKDLIHLLKEYHISYVELDNGNIQEIYDSINNYVFGNHNVLLLNSNLYGCGLNLEVTSDIVFLHKTHNNLKKQIIGRAYRPNRTQKLNIWHLMHENEYKQEIQLKKNNDYHIIRDNTNEYIYNNLEFERENEILKINNTQDTKVSHLYNVINDT